MKKLLAVLLVVVLTVSCFTACGNKDKVITVGASPAPHAEILEEARAYIESKGYELKIVEMTDYNTPNTATEDGSLDANYFQHEPYLDDFNAKNGTHLVSVLKPHFEPLGLYKGAKGSTIANIKAGDKIAVPDDTTNCGRALQLLAANGIIEITNDKGVETTVYDIDAKGLEIIPLEAQSIAPQLPELAFAVINGNYAVDYDITDDCVATEDSESIGASLYGNILVVKEGNENTDKTKVLIEALKQPNIAEFITAQYNGIVVPLK